MIVAQHKGRQHMEKVGLEETSTGPISYVGGKTQVRDHSNLCDPSALTPQKPRVRNNTNDVVERVVQHARAN